MLDGVHEADEAHLAAILEETRVLGRLVDDLRTVALSESGNLPLHREPTDLAIVATDAVGGFRSTAQAAGVALDTEIADDIPLLEVDPVRIREVISNLVANALRHTPSGGSITVDARVDEAGRAVVVTVRDTGTGIDPELLPHVFDRFAKAPGSRGSGLGLAIARGLVEAHGGSIEVESTPDRGSTFRFRIFLNHEAG
jgi:two-component system sensor histidine kinase BaeS